MAEPKELYEELAKATYYDETANHPVIHCNRFPNWEELSQQERDRRIRQEMHDA